MCFSPNEVFQRLFDKISETNEPILMEFLPDIFYNYSYSAYQGLFKIFILTVFFCKKRQKNTLFVFFRKMSAILLFLHTKKSYDTRYSH